MTSKYKYDAMSHVAVFMLIVQGFALVIMGLQMDADGVPLWHFLQAAGPFGIGITICLLVMYRPNIEVEVRVGSPAPANYRPDRHD